jgi:hypothetical protein
MEKKNLPYTIMLMAEFEFLHNPQIQVCFTCVHITQAAVVRVRGKMA